MLIEKEGDKIFEVHRTGMCNITKLSFLPVVTLFFKRMQSGAAHRFYIPLPHRL